MLSLLPTSRAEIESALENGRSLSFGRATVSPSSLPPCMRGLAGDLVIVGLLQMLADAKAQAKRDSETIARLEAEAIRWRKINDELVRDATLQTLVRIASS